MLPSGATSTAVTAAQGTPPGGFAQSRLVTLYPPSGRSLRGWSPAFAANAVTIAATPIAARMKTRARNIERLSLLYVVAADIHDEVLGARRPHVLCVVNFIGTDDAHIARTQPERLTRNRQL